MADPCKFQQLGIYKSIAVANTDYSILVSDQTSVSD